MPLVVKHAKQCLKPDTGDSTMIQPSDWNDEHVIEGFNDFISTSTSFDIKADGSGSYPTLRDLFVYLNGVHIANNSDVTINLDAGIHVQAGEISDTNNHDRIFVRGATPADVTVVACTSVSGTIYDYTVVYTLSANVPPGIIPGMVLVVHNNGVDHTTAYLHFGAHEITAIGVNTLTVKYRGYAIPTTFASQTVACKILKSVVKLGASRWNMWSVVKNRGYWGAPYMKDVALNGADLVTGPLFNSYHGASVHLYPGTQKQYCLAMINSSGNIITTTEVSKIFVNDGTLVISSGFNSGIYADQGSFIDCGSYTIITNCGRSATDTWYYSVVAAAGSYVSILSAIFVNNKFTAKSDLIGRMRCTALRNHAWSSSAITSFNGSTTISA